MKLFSISLKDVVQMLPQNLSMPKSKHSEHSLEESGMLASSYTDYLKYIHNTIRPQIYCLIPEIQSDPRREKKVLPPKLSS